VEVYLRAFLISAPDGDEWSASHPDRFTPRKRAPGTPLDRRMGGPQSQSGRGGEEKNFHPLTRLELPIIQPLWRWKRVVDRKYET